MTEQNKDAVKPKRGDKVRVTFEATVTELDDHKRVAYVDDGNDKWRAYVPVTATVEVLKPADDPSTDPRGLVREYKAGVPAVCYGRDYWVYFGAGSGAGYGIAKDREVIGCRVIGSVPGTPAAEAEKHETAGSIAELRAKIHREEIKQGLREPRVFRSDGPEPPKDVHQVRDRDGALLSRVSDDDLWIGEGDWREGRETYLGKPKPWRQHTLPKYDPYTEVW